MNRPRTKEQASEYYRKRTKDEARLMKGRSSTNEAGASLLGLVQQEDDKRKRRPHPRHPI
jgi:hypothetical protein